MTECGQVVKTEKNHAVVRVARREECSKCGMCGMKKDAAHVDFKAANELKAEVGDTVVVDTEKNVTLLSSLLVFLVPLILLAAAIGVCYALNMEELFILLICVATLALWFTALALIDKRLSRIRGFCPTIVKIIKKQEKGEQENE
ncbi:MAG: hypothetical protein DBX59_04255 [Bacillota bacterium]|nr:MAG: hypothetical protein DBX59_04255 [Bacillota bacterium]